MAAPSKTKKIESLTKLLQKRLKGLPGPPERTVLEHLIYAALLENASFEKADAAYAVLEHHFIDWNEIRVSTVGELADTFPMLPDPQAAGARVRQTLQGVFEKMYTFDLEEWRKKSKNLGQAVEFLESVGPMSRFMIDYTTQVAFGGHVIPLDEASLRIFRLLGMALVNKAGTYEEVSGLERAVPKKNGLTFSIQLHHFAAGYFADPESEELRALLKAIDADSLKRDWTPPVLTHPKISPKPAAPFPAAFPVTIPFVAADDDEFDEDHGTEAEFISEDSDDPSPPSPSKHAGKTDPASSVKKVKAKKPATTTKAVAEKPAASKKTVAPSAPSKSKPKESKAKPVVPKAAKPGPKSPKGSATKNKPSPPKKAKTPSKPSPKKKPK